MATINSPEDRSQAITSAKIDAAMQRAAKRARQVAIDTNTEIVIVRDGKLVHERPKSAD